MGHRQSSQRCLRTPIGETNFPSKKGQLFRVAVIEARKAPLKLRQSYVRLGKRALFKQSRYAAAQQGRRAQKETRRLRTYLGRVIRDIERKQAKPQKAMKELLATVYLSGKRKLTGKLKQLLRRRNAIEPVIGHGKHDSWNEPQLPAWRDG